MKSSAALWSIVPRERASPTTGEPPHLVQVCGSHPFNEPPKQIGQSLSTVSKRHFKGHVSYFSSFDGLHAVIISDLPS